ncbi:hypothetical protein Tsp_09986 [Trichinella spiralis]|uniref:hypothetical protein n=1 Tax=Trichinella spiralis TaxID=6334 RepID=UPI0001EFE3AF|nr:hypothetical protein Tsp_09986 [Trichinella spiralis]
MFPKQRMQYYVEMTKRYGAQKGRNLEVDGDDIEQFFDILLFNGYHSVPSENMLSSTSEDLIMPLVSGTMSRNRFRELKRNFPTMDNTELLPEDKLNNISAISSSKLLSDVTELFETESNRYSSSLSVSGSDISTSGKAQLYISAYHPTSSVCENCTCNSNTSVFRMLQCIEEEKSVPISKYPNF